MPVRVFYGEHSQYEHEYRQICEVYRFLCQDCGDKDIYLLTNFLTGNSEIDCVILKENAIIILEMKSYKGTVTGDENSFWEVTPDTGDAVSMDNVFRQLRQEKFSLIDKLKPIREQNFPRIEEEDIKKIKCWAYFERGSTYDKTQISPGAHIWFDVITVDELGEKLRFADSNILLKTKDMDAIVQGLHLLPELSEMCKSRTRKDTVSAGTTIPDHLESGSAEEQIHRWGGPDMAQLIEFNGNCTSNVSKDAKYSIRNDEGEWKVGIVYETAEGERWYPVSDQHSDLAEMVNRVKKEITKKPGGAFYINEYGQVLVPTANSKSWYLAGEYARPLEFSFEGNLLSGDAKDTNGKLLSPGDEWNSPHPGIAYVLSADGDIYYEREIRPRVTKRFKLSDYQKPEIVRAIVSRISNLKHSAGRFYINEFRQIFTPVGQNPVKYLYIGRLDNIGEWFPKPQGTVINYDGKNE